MLLIEDAEAPDHVLGDDTMKIMKASMQYVLENFTHNVYEEREREREKKKRVRNIF